MNATEQIYIMGRNTHQYGISLFHGTLDEMEEIANSDEQYGVCHVEKIDEFYQKIGWYYRAYPADEEHYSGDGEEGRKAAIESVLTHDAHPISLTLKEAIEHVNNDGANLWHHNKRKLLSFFKEAAEFYGHKFESEKERKQ